MNGKLVSLFQREATARLNAAEHELLTFTKACHGKVVGLAEVNRIRQLRGCVDSARSRYSRWTRYRFLVETGCQ